MTWVYPQSVKEGEERKLFLHIGLSDRGKENTSIALNKLEKVFPLDCSNSIIIYCISSVLPCNCVKVLNCGWTRQVREEAELA